MTYMKSQCAYALKSIHPNFNVMNGLEKHILQVTIKKKDIEIMLSLWGVAKDYMKKYNLDYDDSLKRMLHEIGTENSKLNDITYVFYDDLPNPQLN